MSAVASAACAERVAPSDCEARRDAESACQIEFRFEAGDGTSGWSLTALPNATLSLEEHGSGGGMRGQATLAAAPRRRQQAREPASGAMEEEGRWLLRVCRPEAPPPRPSAARGPPSAGVESRMIVLRVSRGRSASSVWPAFSQNWDERSRRENRASAIVSGTRSESETRSTHEVVI